MTVLEFAEKYLPDVIDVKALAPFQQNWFIQQQHTTLKHHIFKSSVFKRQYFRGKLSRNMKKRVKRETGLDVRSPGNCGEFAYRLGYMGILAGVSGRELAENLTELMKFPKPQKPHIESISRFIWNDLDVANKALHGSLPARDADRSH